MIPVHKEGDRSLVTNYRPVSLISVVCKQMEHVIASYLRLLWDKMAGYTRVNMVSCRDIHVWGKILETIHSTFFPWCCFPYVNFC